VQDLYLNLQFITMKRSSIKVFQIGHNKCGTSSICQFFRKNGYSVIHTKKVTDGTIKKNLAKGDPFLKGLENWDIFTDSDYITREFALLEHLYPNAKFIYNIRPVNNWIKSRVSGQKSGLPWFRNRYGIKNNEDLRNFCWAEYLLHNDRVINHFIGKKSKKLLVFNIEEDKADKLVKFFPEFKFNKFKIFPKYNVSRRSRR